MENKFIKGVAYCIALLNRDLYCPQEAAMLLKEVEISELSFEQSGTDNYDLSEIKKLFALEKEGEQ